jgi:excisionase family DNA binding protein
MAARFISLADAAERWSVDVATLRRAIARGELPGYRLRGGRTIRVSIEELDALFRRIPTARRD